MSNLQDAPIACHVEHVPKKIIALSLQIDQIRLGITVLVPKGAITLTAICPIKATLISRTFTIPAELAASVLWASEHNQAGLNIYWMANYSPKQHARSTAAEVTEARFFWSDIDPKVKEFPSYDGARQDLHDRVLPNLIQMATVIIDSGNGLQALFRLDPIVDLTIPENRDKYLQINIRIAEKFEGPGTHNADRILRLPGTWNYPNAAKIKKGYPSQPRLSSLLHHTNKASDFRDFKTRPIKQPKLPQVSKSLATGSEELNDRFRAFLESNHAANDRYKGGVVGLGDQSGSARDMSLVASMKLGRFTFEETRMLLKDWAHGSSNGRNQGDRYWLRMWDKAEEPSPTLLGGSGGLVKPEVQRAVFGTQLPHSWHKPRYKLKTLDDLKASPPVSYRIKHLLPKRGLASMYGASGSGKTFLVLDCGIAISIGRDWYGHKTEQCPVIYVALEGSFGITNRLSAWEKHHKTPIPQTFRVVTDHLSLFNDGDINEFAQTVLADKAGGGVIFIDTLNQSAPEADENSSKDMGKIISHAMELQALTDSLVVLVHHPGKDLSRGMRGHSSLHAALDAAIEVRKDKYGRAWSTVKAKDGPLDASHSFRLEMVDLGKDADGESVTSCVVLPDHGKQFSNSPQKPKGANQVIALKQVTDLIRHQPAQTGGKPQGAKIEDAITATAAALICDAKHKKERAESAINSLVAGQFLTQSGGYLFVS